MDERPALTLEDAARRLSVSTRTIYRIIQRREMYAVKVGRVWRIPAQSLDSYLRGERNPGD